MRLAVYAALDPQGSPWGLVQNKKKGDGVSPRAAAIALNTYTRSLLVAHRPYGTSQRRKVEVDTTTKVALTVAGTVVIVAAIVAAVMWMFRVTSHEYDSDTPITSLEEACEAAQLKLLRREIPHARERTALANYVVRYCVVRD